MHVPFLDLQAVSADRTNDLHTAVRRVVDSGRYILGPELEAFEAEFAEAVGAAHCVGVGNGLDALSLGLRAMGVRPGDEVLVPSHTFIASWLAVTAVGAVPVPVEPEPGSYLMSPGLAEAAITDRTRALLPVHLYGEPVDVEAFRSLAERHGLALLQDAAQAHGARHDGVPVGTGGTAAWSFYPGKNLGALGDAGAVTTDDDEIAEQLRLLRNYGSARKYEHSRLGVNSRLDEVQAAVLRAKLPHLPEDNARRSAIAASYLEGLAGVPLVLPEPSPGRESSWHLFVVRTPRRDALQAHLTAQGVETLVHYPTAVHRQGAYGGTHGGLDLPMSQGYAAEVLSLPMGPHLHDEQVQQVIAAVADFFARES